MSTSTTDYATLINRVALQTSETEMDDIFADSPINRKFRQFVNMALNDLCNAYDWAWLYQDIPGVQFAWTNERFVLTNFARLVSITYASRQIRVVSVTRFREWTLNPIPDDFIGFPFFNWMVAQVDDNSFLVNPYPTNADNRNKFAARVIRQITPPTQATGTFPFPERYVSLLEKRAVYYAMLRHAHDLEQAQMAEKDYEMQLKVHMDRERTITGVNRFNIYDRYSR
jgi:hypothetical protein